MENIATLRHPNIGHYIAMEHKSDSFGTITLEIVTEYVGGGTLARLLRAGPLSPEVMGSALSWDCERWFSPIHTRARLATL